MQSTQCCSGAPATIHHVKAQPGRPVSPVSQAMVCKNCQLTGRLQHAANAVYAADCMRAQLSGKLHPAFVWLHMPDCMSAHLIVTRLWCHHTMQGGLDAVVRPARQHACASNIAQQVRNHHMTQELSSNGHIWHICYWLSTVPLGEQGSCMHCAHDRPIAKMPLRAACIAWQDDRQHC